MKNQTKEVAIKGSYDIVKPDDMARMANVLKTHIVKNKLYTTISGKNYAHVEGWQFAGGLMGLFPLIKDVNDISKTGEIKWTSTAEIVNIKTEKVVGRGFALCSNKENKKKSFDEYAILSMAQTRSIGKAYRNLIGWVMKLAGMEGTPSEEMTRMGDKPSVPQEYNQTVPSSEKVVGPDGSPVIVCRSCDEIIDEQVAGFSKKMYGKHLCRNCQKVAKRK